MNGDSGQTEERSESRQERENELRSLRSIPEAMKAPEEKYAEGLSTLADLLADLNTTSERLVELAIEIRDFLKKG